MQYTGKSLLWLSLVSMLLFTTGCRSDKVISHWKDHPITIDGDQSDWQTGYLWVAKGKPVTMGVSNDESYLYLTLSTSDQELMLKALRLGLIVWLDPTGGTKKTLGIKYPTGLFGSGQRSARTDRGPVSRAANIPQMIRALSVSQPWLELLGPNGNEAYQLPAADTALVHVRLDYSEYGQLVYELKLPLSNLPDFPHAYSIDPGGKLGIGFATGSMGISRMRGSGPGGGMPGGRPGGMPGGMPGGRPGGIPGGGMRGGGPRPGTMEPFNYWMQVTLVREE